jgi:shikimate dehydrogenase
MRKFGLIGYPLGHSFSKTYFNEKFIKENITDCSYENFSLENLDHFIDLVQSDKELCGLNVTIPYKTSVIKFLNRVDPEANEIGAVNVIKILRNPGKTELCGYNSDVTGIYDTLLPIIERRVRNALVLGTGGGSKAVCYVLEKLMIRFDVVSREKKPGCLVYSDIDSSIINTRQLIVNTTPLGMFPNIKTRPDINYTMLNKKHILFDLVYNPEITEFLRLGAVQGCTTIGGLIMLTSQAEKSWEIWNKEDNPL